MHHFLNVLSSPELLSQPSKNRHTGLLTTAPSVLALCQASSLQLAQTSSDGRQRPKRRNHSMVRIPSSGFFGFLRVCSNEKRIGPVNNQVKREFAGKYRRDMRILRGTTYIFYVLISLLESIDIG